MDDDGARALIVTGAGDDAFCAGADLKALETLDGDAPGGPLGFTRLASPKPTIAAVSGWCLAGGFELALWCDLRVAAPSARFGFTERRFGVPLIDGGTQRLPRIVGSGRALDLVISGRVIDVEEAERFGLVTEIAAEPRRSARWRWPRRSPPSRRTRCSPTAARCWRAPGCRSSRASRSRRSSAAAASRPGSRARSGLPPARAAAERAPGSERPLQRPLRNFRDFAGIRVP